MKNADFTLSINISALHIQDESLFDDIAGALIESDFPSKNLEIEITETTLVSSVTDAVKLLNKIKKLGVKIALDDFGTGYASLSNLSELPIDMIKIDKIVSKVIRVISWVKPSFSSENITDSPTR